MGVGANPSREGSPVASSSAQSSFFAGGAGAPQLIGAVGATNGASIAACSAGGREGAANSSTSSAHEATFSFTCSGSAEGVGAASASSEAWRKEGVASGREPAMRETLESEGPAGRSRSGAGVASSSSSSSGATCSSSTSAGGGGDVRPTINSLTRATVRNNQQSDHRDEEIGRTSDLDDNLVGRAGLQLGEVLQSGILRAGKRSVRKGVVEVSHGGGFAGGSVLDDVGENGRDESGVGGSEEVVEMEELEEIDERGVGFDLSYEASALRSAWEWETDLGGGDGSFDSCFSSAGFDSLDSSETGFVLYFLVLRDGSV